MKYLLPPVKYYRANLHTHSTISDGKMTPEEVRDAYKAKGYSILAMTDHSVIVPHPELQQEDFLVLTGVEIDTSDKYAPDGDRRGRCVHLCLIAKEKNQNWLPYRDLEPKDSSVPYERFMDYCGMSMEYSPENINAIIAECNKRGYLVTYNHPVWSLESYPEYAPLKGLWAMEYQNGSCCESGYDENNGHVYQDLCVLGNRLMPVCADDTHRPTTVGWSWTMIGAEKLTYESVIEAMEQGVVYSSCGPEIYSVAWDGQCVHVKCSPCVRVQVVTQMRAVAVQRGENLTEVTLDMSRWAAKCADKDNAFLRLILTDASGNYAVTRAYFIDELREE